MADKTTESVRIADLIDRVSRAVQRLQYTGGLNPAQWVALRYIAQANRYSRSPSAVAEYLGTTKGTASQTLKALGRPLVQPRLRDAIQQPSEEVHRVEGGFRAGPSLLRSHRGRRSGLGINAP